jgi:hypothetical protein
MNKKQIIERLIRLTFDSLESHLPYTHQKSAEGRAFHTKCVQEYSEMIYLLSKLYEEEGEK